MNFRKNILGVLLFTLPLLFSPLLSQAQIEAVNADGDKIWVYPDGSWKYMDEEKEAARQAANRSAGGASEEMVGDYSRDEVVAAREEIAALFRKARREKISAQQEEARLRNELDAYVAEKAADKKAGRFPKNDQDWWSYRSRVKFLKKRIKAAKKKRKAAQKDERTWQSMLNKSGEKMMAAYEKNAGKIRKAQADGEEALARQEKEKEGEEKSDGKLLGGILKKKKTPEELAKERYEERLAKMKKEAEEQTEAMLEKARKRSEDLERYISSPEAPRPSCRIAFDEADPITGKRKMAVKSGRLFSAVEEQNEALLKGRGFVEGHAFLSSVNDGKDHLLVLDLLVRSKDAYGDYGGLEKGGKIGLAFLDGKQITLDNNRADKGEVDEAKAVSRFRGYYPLSKSDLKDLEEHEIVLLRVYWANGFEDYEILDLDFFRNQVRCLRENE